MERDATLVVAARVLSCLALAVGLAACGGGSGGSSAPAPSGKLTLTGCTIEAEASSCGGTIAWTTSSAVAPRVNVSGATVSTAASGTMPLALGPDRVTVTLLDGATPLDEQSLAGACASAAAWNGSKCVAFARKAVERAPTPFFESGRAVTLEVVLYRPLGTGPFPAVMFHHGSTGNGDNPALFTQTFVSESVARFFVERGMLVAFPQRRGRGASDGRYDEGFEPDRSRYSCSQGPALAGLERALQDADAAYDYLRSHADIDGTRLVVAGTSRGGILAMAHAARRPSAFRAAVNFVGGWLGEGCADAVAVNRTTFAAAAAYAGPTTWLYGEEDTFYSVAHSRANFDAFAGAGGRGSFKVYRRAPGLNGHFVINDAGLWSQDLEEFLRQSGMTTR